MPANEQRAVSPREQRSGLLGDAQLGAARVRDQRMAPRKLSDVRKDIERRTDRQSDVYEICAFHCLLERAGRSLINDAAPKSFVGDIRAIPAVNKNVRGAFFQSESEGTADESGSENRDALNEMRGHKGKSLQ